jgi:hypothetical protein
MLGYFFKFKFKETNIQKKGCERSKYWYRAEGEKRLFSKRDWGIVFHRYVGTRILMWQKRCIFLNLNPGVKKQTILWCCPCP